MMHSGMMPRPPQFCHGMLMCLRIYACMQQHRALAATAPQTPSRY